MRNKRTAGLFALFFGAFGLHRFYLGQRFLGFVTVFVTIFLFILTIEEGAPFLFLAGIWGLVDALLFFAMPQENFDEKFNSRKLSRRERRLAKMKPQRSTQQNFVADTPSSYRSETHNPYKRIGIEKVEDYQFEDAIVYLQKALQVDYEDSDVHFYLACAYSIEEQTYEAFFHLDKAVAFGFVDFKQIHTYEPLAFLRASEDFGSFVANGYQIVQQLPMSEEETFLPSLKSTPATQQQADNSTDLIEQIITLGELKDKGILTNEEFVAQKKRLLG